MRALWADTATWTRCAQLPAAHLCIAWGGALLDFSTISNLASSTGTGPYRLRCGAMRRGQVWPKWRVLRSDLRPRTRPELQSETIGEMVLGEGDIVQQLGPAELAAHAKKCASSDAPPALGMSPL